jgi:hypothetical protein
MIAVATNPEHRAAVSEFFELFKTAWEFYRGGEEYDAVICCGVIPSDVRARLVLVYASNELSFDQQHQLQVLRQNSEEVASYRGWRLPLYAGLASVIGSEKKHHLVADKTKSKSTFATEMKIDGQIFIRIGYDLFAEVRHLLSNGQPLEVAHVPSIEIHITILRDILVEYQVPFDEVPPVPAGYNFIVCLTHDVDHFAIANHKFDHTMFGFLYRASVGSILELFRGRKSLRQVCRNWLAVLSLPLVYLGILPDFWSKLERYLELDHASTFFVIAKKDEAGLTASGRLPRRAVRYDLSQLQTSVSEILAHRGEIALHGIDAWCDTREARKEREQIQALTHSPEVGVRMHWLFFDSESAGKLDEAGFSYDSTVGYNETVGYRAGTTQAFRPFGTKRLLELPLHIMDTALFYPAHLHLSPQQAMMRINDMVDDMRQFGGVLMVNWHDRSIAPERLWDDFYAELVEKLESAGAWFCTAAEAAQWFRRRREVTFGTSGSEAALAAIRDETGPPGLRIRSYQEARRSALRTAKDCTADASCSEVLLGEAKEIAQAL